MENNIILEGDAIAVLKDLPPKAIDTCCTSPPYFQLRDYKIANQLGAEATPEEYISSLCNIFDEVKRILKPTGLCFVNLGDTYNGTKIKSIPYKSLMQIPARFALEMTNRGWTLRNKIIWYKPNAMPSSTTDRFSVDYEEIFMFSQSPQYFFEQQIEPYISEPNHTLHDKASEKYKDTDLFSEGGRDYYSRGGRNKRCVWTINTKPYPEAHFATFPETLIEPIISSSCPSKTCSACGTPYEKKWEITKKGSAKAVPEYMESIGSSLSHAHTRERGAIIPDQRKLIGLIPLCSCPTSTPSQPGIVLDPFFGSGTTGLVALKQNKSFLGIELNPEYITLAQKRLHPWLNQSRLGSFI